MTFVLTTLLPPVVLVAVLILTGTPILKLIVRSLGWTEALRICAIGISIAFGVVYVIILLIQAGGADLEVHDITNLTMPAFPASGWLISRGLRRIGRPQRFPGAGAAVVVGWFILSWIVFGLVFLVAKFAIR